MRVWGWGYRGREWKVAANGVRFLLEIDEVFLGCIMVMVLQLYIVGQTAIQTTFNYIC